MQKKSDTSVHSVQNLRGIAAVLVVFSHLFTNIPESNSKLLRGLVDYSVFGTLGVEMFFIISGFIIPYSLYTSKYSIRHWKHFLTKRLIRIYLPYIASIIFITLLYLLWNTTFVGFSNPFKFSLYQVILNAFFINPFFQIDFINYAYWTLFVEIQYYFLIALLFPVILRYGYFGALVIGVTLFSFNFIFDVGALLLHSNYILFTVGTIFYLFHTKQISKSLFVSVILSLLIVQLYWHQFHLHWDRAIPIVIISIISIILLLTFTFENFFFSFLGSISYSLYLTHQPLIVFMNELFRIIQIQNSVTLKLLELVFLLFVAWLFYISIEKPSQELTKLIKKRS